MLKIKSRYFQISFCYRIGLSNMLRSRGEGLKFLNNLKKWKTSDFPYSMVRLN